MSPTAEIISTYYAVDLSKLKTFSYDIQ